MSTNAAKPNMAGNTLKSKVMGNLKSMFGEKTLLMSTIIMLVLAGVFVIIIIVIYIVSQVKKNKLNQIVLQQDVIQIDNPKEVPFLVKDATMSSVTLGQEFSMSFWIYLGPQYQATTGHKMILQRGSGDTQNSTLNKTTNPAFFMDKSTNKMYIALATNKVSGSYKLDDVLTSSNTGFIVTTIDYVPLQRWVNICLAVRDNNGYVFVDGDMYSVISVSDVAMMSSAATSRPIIAGTSGDVMIGNRMNTTNGFLAYASYFNYALTQSQIRAIYQKGPYPSTFLSYFGLGNYAWRTPLYRID